MKKLLIATSIMLMATVAQAADQAVVDLYNKSCIACHASGAAGAPKTGDVAQWASRLEKGMDALVTSADKGLNAMPPKGLCYSCSTDDYKALIEHMAAAK